ncbi:MAG: phosphatase PAP2 family protein [Aureispira sp.]|nr:phosphatase PAP2 family protein [Aureispira sp.]
MLESLFELDKWLFGLVNGDWHNSFLDTIFPYWRDKKTWIPLYVLFAVLLGVKYQWKVFWVLLMVGIVILIADQTSSELLKKSIERVRPCNDSSLPNVRILVHCGGGFSFTSSHATNHFALATILYLSMRHFWTARWLPWALYLWAFSIAYGQVYVGVHFPLDVFCGALLGMLIGWGVYGVFRRIDKRSNLSIFEVHEK